MNVATRRLLWIVHRFLIVIGLIPTKTLLASFVLADKAKSPARATVVAMSLSKKALVVLVSASSLGAVHANPNSRIVGGRPVENPPPYYAAFGHYKDVGCGGVLIAPDKFLTAGEFLTGLHNLPN